MESTDQIRVQVIFTFPADGNMPSYTDALYFTPDEYAALSPTDLDAQKQERYNNWLTVISQPQDSNG